METFHSSVQSLGNSSAQLQAWPKNKGDAHLLSPLAQPESSPAWAAAGASGDVLLETLCMALGLEPGGTVTLQTDRHSWGAQGDNPLALLGHQGGWEGRCPWDCMREMLPLHQHAGERYQRGDPSSTGQKHRGTNGGGGETCTYHCPHLPPRTGVHSTGGQEGRVRAALLPREQVQRPPPPVPAVQEGSIPKLHYLQVSVVVGRHTETASPPPVPVMRTGCTESPILAAVGHLCRLTALGLHSSPVPAAQAEYTGPRQRVVCCWLPEPEQGAWRRMSTAGAASGPLDVLWWPWTPAGLEGAAR